MNAPTIGSEVQVFDNYNLCGWKTVTVLDGPSPSGEYVGKHFHDTFGLADCDPTPYDYVFFHESDIVNNLPILSIERNNAGDLFIGVTEFSTGGVAVRSYVLSHANEYTADSVMLRRFEDMCDLMRGNVRVLSYEIQDYIPLEDD